MTAHIQYLGNLLDAEIQLVPNQQSQVSSPMGSVRVGQNTGPRWIGNCHLSGKQRSAATDEFGRCSGGRAISRDNR